MYIKNMVCDRCIKTVKKVFSHNGIDDARVSLGRVIIDNYINVNMDSLSKDLINEGFEIIIDQDKKLVNQIKSIIINTIHHQDQKPFKMSDNLASKLNRSYSNLSHLFSQIEQKTIEQFTIEHKIEKAKELLTYAEMTISEISYLLDYSSPQHFARQFKKITGITPTEFIKDSSRKKLDTI